ncbi:MAG: diguanylate cyclase, partial [Pseudomonadota bacterium]
FWQVLAVGTMTTAAYLVFLQSAGAPADAVGFEAFIICAMTSLAAIFIYNLEHTLRRSFLQQHALEHLSNVDALTGLKNRRVFEESLEMLWKQGMRDKQPIGMILIDVDHFKNYNDLYGHAAGDRCLKTVGGLLRGAVKRPLDLAARLGGEEFALLCYGSTKKHVSALAESVRRAVVDASIPHAASSAAEHVTVSVGAVFVQPGIGRSSQSLYQYADEALYAAKSNGRNRIEVLDSGYSNIVTGAFKVN